MKMKFLSKKSKIAFLVIIAIGALLLAYNSLGVGTIEYLNLEKSYHSLDVYEGFDNKQNCIPRPSGAGTSTSGAGTSGAGSNYSGYSGYGNGSSTTTAPTNSGGFTGLLSDIGTDIESVISPTSYASSGTDLSQGSNSSSNSSNSNGGGFFSNLVSDAESVFSGQQSNNQQSNNQQSNNQQSNYGQQSNNQQSNYGQQSKYGQQSNYGQQSKYGPRGTRQIPEGDEDLYILKSEIVPPVCPVCPSVTPCPYKETPPCPACARCPDSSFECKKVPNYGSNGMVPMPVLSDFSTFGM